MVLAVGLFVCETVECVQVIWPQRSALIFSERKELLQEAEDALQW